MPKTELLPGVTEAECPPVVVVDSRRAIVRARRRAVAYDIAQLLLLAGVDWMFVRWPAAHVPMLDRGDSVLVVFALNVGMLGYLWLERALPRWTARRIAETWCASERARFRV